MQHPRRAAIVAGIGVVGLLAGVAVGRLGPTHQLRETGQYDLMDGYALIREATTATKPATSLRSRMAWYNGGIQALWLAREPLSHLGIRGAYAAIASLQEADYALLRPESGNGDASRQQRAVVTGFLNAFAPFRNEAYGSISESAIQGAFNRVDHVIR